MFHPGLAAPGQVTCTRAVGQGTWAHHWGTEGNSSLQGLVLASTSDPGASWWVGCLYFRPRTVPLLQELCQIPAELSGLLWAGVPVETGTDAVGMLGGLWECRAFCLWKD